ncbi:MAG: hypothetical protein ACJZ63_01690 [Candidatus Poseidoniaceae archaeon]
MGKDPLDVYAALASCPNCGCFERKGTVRCSECGTFHSGIHMEERNAPANPEPVQREPIDPTAYSLSAEQALPDEIFEETEDLVNWDGGSSDFTMEEIEELPLSRVDPDDLVLPDPEDLTRVED